MARFGWTARRRQLLDGLAEAIELLATAGCRRLWLDLRSVLRQLRGGYPSRPGRFPASVVLCGLRDVRDYRAAAGSDLTRLGTAVELKVWRPGRRDPVEDGLEQLDAYLNRLDLDHGTLVVFDRRPEAAPIDEGTGFAEARTPSGRPATVLRA